jgi:hypothetical protein
MIIVLTLAHKLQENVGRQMRNIMLNIPVCLTAYLIARRMVKIPYIIT